VLLASGAALLVAAGAGVFVTVRSAVPPGSGGGQAVAAATTPAPAVPSPPPGWTGGMPRTAEDWVSLGRAYDKAHQLPQAVAAYDMALRLQPGDDGITLLRADVQVRSGDAAQALPDLRQLRDRHPDNPDVLLVLGLAENRTGSADADATLRRFLQLAPDSPAAPGVRTLLGIG
jgi:cytochrome c-type biogenesis protein CcmH